MTDVYKGLKRFRDYQNNTNISIRNKYLYCAVDKVANSTIKALLYKIEYGEVWKENYIDRKSLREKRLSPLLSPFQLPSDLLDEVYKSDGYKRFCFVRNPYSRLLSCYLDRIADRRSFPSREVYDALGKSEELVTFKEFIELVCEQNSVKQNSHWRRQVDDVMLCKIKFDFVGKFENLNNDLLCVSKLVFGDILPELLDLGINYSPSKTNASDKLYEWYDQYLESLVYESYKQDFEAFGYDRLVFNSCS
ncbi:sulfotransferase family protein [Marinobacterium aestuariivivens]|uniref:Sulfotransferase family protein n=1 Tax=Marinobacterium aestuariivivens TaxID=1698799 RepID=A0ABW1ZUQ1_9GAMM